MHSKAVIQRAVRSEQGPRLVELALARQKLAGEALQPPTGYESQFGDRLHDVREIINARIEMIEQEISSIIDQYGR